MGRAKLFTKQDILRAMAVTKSNKAAARYLNCDMRTYRTYSRLYIDDETGKTLNATDASPISNVVKFGSGAGYFDATNSWIDVPDSPDWDFGTGDFTVEWWEYRLGVTSGRTVFTRDKAASFPAFNIGSSDGTNLLVYMSSNGSSFDIANGKTFGAFTLNTWIHYAICRSGTTFYMFKNGTQTDTWTSSAALNPSTAVLTIGNHLTNWLDAVLDEVRVLTKNNCSICGTNRIHINPRTKTTMCYFIL